MTLSELLDLHIQEKPQLSPRTIEKYQAVIRNFTNDTGINSIFFDRQNCIDWYNKIYNRVSPTTCNSYCLHLKVLFNTAVKLGHLDKNVFTSLPTLKNRVKTT